MTVAALYIDNKGPYPRMSNVDCWDERRDARTYAGPWPVVAHPPCGAYGNLRHLSFGAGKDCAPIAVEQVRQFGGVLEHPAGSKLWNVCHLPLPGGLPDEFGGFAVEVEQVAWGHAARKKTWLYFVGVAPALVFSSIRSGGTPTHWVSGGRKRSRKGRGGVIPPGIKVCSANMRRRSPQAFAEWLVELAESVNAERAKVCS